MSRYLLQKFRFYEKPSSTWIDFFSWGKHLPQGFFTSSTALMRFDFLWFHFLCLRCKKLSQDIKTEYVESVL